MAGLRAVTSIGSDSLADEPYFSTTNGESNGSGFHRKSKENETILTETAMLLELEDGYTAQCLSFGAPKSIAGELVFQTGMVGYPESITDPSYRGQILVITFPLIGNYGVPSRATPDKIIGELPAHFEAAEVHIAGLVVASYAGEDYSHYLAISSLGAWLKEQGVPAVHGIDTRALTKRIREKGSMLGKLRLEKKETNGLNTDDTCQKNSPRNAEKLDKQTSFQSVSWSDPNTHNLVAAGTFVIRSLQYTAEIENQSPFQNLTSTLLIKRAP